MEAIDIQLAKAIVRTADIRENSFDNDLYQKEYEKAVTEQRVGTMLGVDPETFYTKNIQEAAIEAATELKLPAAMADLIHTMLLCAWNDTLGWAETLLGEKK